jgi:hypothetical protein
MYFAGTQGQVNNGPTIWSTWTGDTLRDYYTGQYVDGIFSAPTEDRLLFDIFTTRFNDNSVRGTLPINVGAGHAYGGFMPWAHGAYPDWADGGLADWSALFSGMVVLTNNATDTALLNQMTKSKSTPPMTNYTWQYIQPVGTNVVSSPLWQIISNINATRFNTTNFPFQSFVHAGDILQTPALTEQSPFLNWNDPWQQEWGINDELYEWLPQQMMGLVRASEPRYVIYCYGQTLRPAPNGYVLNGSNYQLVTNYQVVAESAIRAVVRIDNANSTQPRAVVESYNILPPN